jgi:hypothetical protein
MAMPSAQSRERHARELELESDVASLRDAEQAIAKQVAATEAAATGAQRQADTPDQRLHEDRQQLRDLQQRVDSLERAQAQSGAPR